MPPNAAANTFRAPAEHVVLRKPYFAVDDLRTFLLFALAYFAAYGYGSLFSQTTSSPLWFPDSVLLCALLLTPLRKWWFYLLAAFSIRLIPGLHPPVPHWFLFATCTNDLLKGLFAASLLRRITPDSTRLSSVRTFVVYLGVAVLLAPMLSAFGGAAARRELGYAFWPAWNQWFLGDAIANLVLTPAILYWCNGLYRELRPRVLEILCWIVGFTACLYYSLSLIPSPIPLYAPVPFLIWAAIRFGPIGASSALSFIALLSMVSVAGGKESVSASLGPQHVLTVQLFLAVMSVPVLCVAILIQERGAVETRLRENQETLSENYDRVRDLAAKLINAQDDERRRIALELHDDISQRMALLSMSLEDCCKKLPEWMAKERTQLSNLKTIAEEVQDAIRDLSHELHSSAFHHLGLVTGLRGLCRTISHQHHIAVDLQVNETPNLPYALSLCLFRVAQEALANAVKHGKAKQIAVQLAQNASSIRLVVSDDGIGFDAISPSNGLGLESMQERVRIVGGTFTLASSPGQGTTVEVVAETARVMRAGAG
jgi:signal transduction histidine kinase